MAHVHGHMPATPLQTLVLVAAGITSAMVAFIVILLRNTADFREAAPYIGATDAITMAAMSNMTALYGGIDRPVDPKEPDILATGFDGTVITTKSVMNKIELGVLITLVVIIALQKGGGAARRKIRNDQFMARRVQDITDIAKKAGIDVETDSFKQETIEKANADMKTYYGNEASQTARNRIDMGGQFASRVRQGVVLDQEAKTAYDADIADRASGDSNLIRKALNEMEGGVKDRADAAKAGEPTGGAVEAARGV